MSCGCNVQPPHVISSDSQLLTATYVSEDVVPLADMFWPPCDESEP